MVRRRFGRWFRLKRAHCSHPSWTHITQVGYVCDKCGKKLSKKLVKQKEIMSIFNVFEKEQRYGTGAGGLGIGVPD